MRTILVPAAGSATDAAVFETALAAARPLNAHLEFLHIRIGAPEAAAFAPHLDFAPAPALREELHRLESDQEARRIAARHHVRDFCRSHDVELEGEALSDVVSASWHEERDDAASRLLWHARRSDLVVVGRAAHRDGLPPDLIERLVLGCGRPVLVASREARPSFAGAILVAWQETPASARALAAAMPLLSQARRVVIASVAGGQGTAEDVSELARRLTRKGIAAEARWIASAGKSAAARLEAAVLSCDADLLVMGAYDHTRARELVFGGCTQHFIARAERPVLLSH